MEYSNHYQAKNPEPGLALGVFDESGFDYVTETDGENPVIGCNEDPFVPTVHSPGNYKKVQVMALRYRAGLPIFFEGDKPDGDGNEDGYSSMGHNTHNSHKRKRKDFKNPVESESLEDFENLEDSEEFEELNPTLPTLPIINLTTKTCSVTGKTFECGAGSGNCWCQKIPVVKVEPDKDCLSEPALLNVAMRQGKIKYSHCPECNTPMGPVRLLLDEFCPICQKIVKEPLSYNDIKWVNL